MRLFPRAPRHRLWAASAACSLAVGAVAVPLAHANDDLKHRQEQVEGQIEHADHELDQSSARLRKATAALAAAEAGLAEARAELTVARSRLEAARLRDQQMQARLDVAVERLAAAGADLAEGQAALETQRLHVTDTITAIYQEGDPQLLAFASLLDAETPADLTRRMGAQHAIVGRDTRAYDDLHAAEVLLQVREDEVEAARDEVAAQRAAAAEHLVTMRGLHEESRAAQARVREVVQERRSARQAAAQARARDQVALARLKQRERQIRQQILDAARTARGGYRGRTDGFLNYPVQGSITSPFGYREHPIYHYWGLHDGADFGAGCGAPLYAAAGGTVLSRYHSAVWGNRLYLDLGTVNGKNLTVVYNHLSSYGVQAGQRVDRGDVVGAVGSTGWSTGCHLHFTVLVNGAPVNPSNWF